MPSNGSWSTAIGCTRTCIAGGGSTPASPSTCWRRTTASWRSSNIGWKGYVDRDSKVDHLVTIERGAEIINSVVRGPAIIGEDTRIVNSYVGPFTSIHHHVLVDNSEIEHSIVLDNSRIVDIPSRIEDSIIGRDVELTYSPIKPKAYKMTLGDHSRVGLL